MVEEAKSGEEIVKQREELHGHPYENFAVIAGFWDTYLRSRFKGKLFPFDRLSRMDVARMMVLFKVGRDTTSPAYNPENPLDMQGYAECMKMIHEKEVEEFHARTESIRTLDDELGEPHG